jgi:hypothetical protein
MGVCRFLGCLEKIERFCFVVVWSEYGLFFEGVLDLRGLGNLESEVF